MQLVRVKINFKKRFRTFAECNINTAALKIYLTLIFEDYIRFEGLRRKGKRITPFRALTCKLSEKKVGQDIGGWTI